MNDHVAGDKPERGVPADRVIAAGDALVQLVEGVGCQRWVNSSGHRLKDTTEWCEFYVAMKEVAE